MLPAKFTLKYRCLLWAFGLVLTGCSSVERTPMQAPVTQPIDSSSDSHSQATPGVLEDRIVFGQSAAFSGPAAELGTNLRLGLEAAFNEVNLIGGVHGRVLELKSLDDAYEPEAAIANTRHLIDEDNVFALIGAVGTPTSRSATPITVKEGVPYIAPFTGAGFLRQLLLQNVINLRASYGQETEEMVARLTSDMNFDRIGILYQDDSYGRAGYDGVVSALTARGLEPVAVGIYPRNTTAVKTALIDLMQGNPQAVIMIGAYEPVATFILWARQIGMDVTFMTVSFVGSNALAQELASDGAGVIVSQVVPFPADDTVPVVNSYLNALQAYEPAAVPGFVSLEGYLAGRLVISGLEGCGLDVDRSCIATSLIENSPFSIDGFQLDFSSQDNQGSDAVFLTQIGSNGQYHPIETLHEIIP